MRSPEAVFDNDAADPVQPGCPDHQRAGRVGEGRLFAEHKHRDPGRHERYACLQRAGARTVASLRFAAAAAAAAVIMELKDTLVYNSSVRLLSKY